MRTRLHEYTSITGARALAARAALALIGMTLGLGVVTPAQAQTYRVIYTFTGGTDGANPYAPLIRDSVGNLYGTTTVGGTFNAGTVFKVDKAGQETVLYTFTGGADGWSPYSGLVRDAAGNLYGTTEGGGAVGFGGALFEVSTVGIETVLHSFTGPPDGDRAYAGLIRDAEGDLYGTTEGGGEGAGTVFKVDPSGAETILHSFGAAPDGNNPIYAGVIRDEEGNFYGTTEFGGANRLGTVFKLSRGGKEAVLHSFAGGTDGQYPFASLVVDAASNLYGTTGSGGAYALGTVFKIDTTGKETVLHSFAGYPTDGELSYSALAIDAAGNLYGTTAYGGSDELCRSGASTYGCGIVFKLDTTGKETILHNFTAGPGGRYPIGGLLLDSAGNLYGATSEGGDFAGCVGGCGVVFEVTP